MSASERQTFARKNDGELAFDLRITGQSEGDQPRSLVVYLHAEDGMRSLYRGDFSGYMHPDELRILARLLVAMADRCDAANEALARGAR